MLALALALACPGLASAATLIVSVTGADGAPAAQTVVIVRPASAPAGSGTAAGTATVTQRQVRFHPAVTVATVGTRVRFLNEDPFAHHVRSLPTGPLGALPPAQNFELRLPAAVGGATPAQELRLTDPGVIGVGCHLHGSMRAHLYVTTSPWHAVTDTQGRAVIEGVPEGEAELRLWHADQLLDQPAQSIVVKTNAAESASRLNFSPRRPRVRG